MAYSAKNRPLKKRHVEFQPGTPKIIVNQPEEPQFLCNGGASNLEPVTALEPLDIHVHEEDAAALLGDISTTCLADTVPQPVVSSNSSALFEDLIGERQISLLTSESAKCETSAVKNRSDCSLSTVKVPPVNVIRKCIGCPFLAKSSHDLKDHYKVCTSELFGSATANETVKREALKTSKKRQEKKKKSGDQELYECQYCQFYSRSFRAFTMHLRSHSRSSAANNEGVAPIDKQTCPKCGVFVFNLRNHAIKQHARADGSSKNFVCLTCGYLANSPRQLKQHVQARHKSGSKSYRCKICNKEYAYLPSLYRHQLQHSGDRDRLYPRVCPTCGARFRSRSTLDAHVISRHTADRPFGCDFCQKRFATRSLLSQHKIVHSPATTGDPAHSLSLKCDQCQREFKRAGDLRKHISCVHKGEKPFACRTGCDKFFSDASSRKRHERTHTGEKPFACEHCPMRFCQSSGLNAHVKAKHSKADSSTSIKKSKKSSSEAVQPLIKMSQPPVASTCSFLDSSGFNNILPTHNDPAPVLASDNPHQEPLHHFDYIYGNEIIDMIEKATSGLPVPMHSDGMLWPPFAFSAPGTDHQMTCSSATNSSQFYTPVSMPSEAPGPQPPPPPQTITDNGDNSHQAGPTARHVQSLACDTGVLSVLNELVATGRLEQCPFCSYLASSNDALCQHVRVQHGEEALQLHHL